MKPSQALRLLPERSFSNRITETESHPQSIAFVGAGGKSSAMFQLARELPPPVLITATTHLGIWQIPLADHHIVAKDASELHDLNPRDVTLITGSLEGDRTKGLGNDAILWLREISKKAHIPLLIEADGSRKKPLKAPAEYEPPIPAFIDQVIVVAGLSGLGKPLNEELVHRAEIFSKLTSLKDGHLVTPEALVAYLTHPAGGLKNIPATARHVVLLNQADTPELQAMAHAMVRPLLAVYDAVLIASLQEQEIYAVHEPVAGIVLAAGEAVRFGQPKQLLDWRGQPFVRVVTKTALQAMLKPVIVITGAYTEQVESAIQGLKVQVVYNENWKEGQASSVKVGLSTLTPVPSSSQGDGKSGSVIFLLADQPHITPTILQALIEEHARSLSPIVAPMVIDRRANPVLFDRVTFSDFMSLQGDVGGRGIFSKHRVNYLPWHDDSLLLDVDKPEDYHRLKDLLE